jgi:selenocysteine lyase/cysteine desulfurase
VKDAETFVVIDGYHGFMAVPTDLGPVAGRAFYLAGGYKYAMAGEGACFLHCPLGYGLRPRDTGWYAGFSALEGGAARVGYGRDGSRFLGATFDVTALYRVNAVQDWLAREGRTVPAMLAQVRGIERAFLRESRSLQVNGANLLVPDEARRGRFLAFRTEQAGAIVARLAAKGIIADHRGDRLRIGFGIYHGEDDARRLAQALA